MDVEASLFRTGELRALDFGELFLPVGDGEPFLLGRMNDQKVLICLGGPDAFEIAPADQWNRPTGLVFANVRFLVSLESGSHGEVQTNFNGALVPGLNGTSIITVSHVGRYTVALSNGENETRLPRDTIVFKRWKIVVGDPDHEVTLFEHGM